MATPNQPVGADPHLTYLPGTKIETADGRASIIASVIVRDDGEPEEWEWLVLLLLPQAPYYALANMSPKETYVYALYPNIVPAVEAYQQDGGDY